MTHQTNSTIISTQEYEKKIEIECMFIMHETRTSKEKAYQLAKNIVDNQLKNI